MILEYCQVERQPVTLEYRPQFVTPPVKVDSRALKGVLDQALAVAVTEDIGEEHLRIVPRRLEKDDVGAAILVFVAIHPDLHPGVDDGAESLRKHHGEPPVLEILLLPGAAPRCQFGIEGNQRVDAQYQFGTFLEGDGGMQGLDQRAVDEVVVADADGREESGQGGARLDRCRDRDVIVTR